MANNDTILDAFKNKQPQEVAVDATRKFRVGIVGCGWIAEAHIAAYSQQPDVEIVAGCDLIPGKAKEFFEKFHHFEYLFFSVDIRTICKHHQSI